MSRRSLGTLACALVFGLVGCTSGDPPDEAPIDLPAEVVLAKAAVEAAEEAGVKERFPNAFRELRRNMHAMRGALELEGEGEAIRRAALVLKEAKALEKRCAGPTGPAPIAVLAKPELPRRDEGHSVAGLGANPLRTNLGEARVGEGNEILPLPHPLVLLEARDDLVQTLGQRLLPRGGAPGAPIRKVADVNVHEPA
ncbi:MAG: hypothetical protein JKY65_10000 [Planctomycetes bacterium]|nr:hypothetical protein [Planctomycetota bacterium]